MQNDLFKVRMSMNNYLVTSSYFNLEEAGLGMYGFNPRYISVK